MLHRANRTIACIYAGSNDFKSKKKGIFNDKDDNTRALFVGNYQRVSRSIAICSAISNRFRSSVTFSAAWDGASSKGVITALLTAIFTAPVAVLSTWPIARVLTACDAHRET